MKRTAWLDRLFTAAAVLALTTVAVAQPPEGGPPHDPLRAALDADGDHALSADEIKQAASAVARLDRNGDGRIDHEEFRPQRPPRRGLPGDGDDARRPPRDGAAPPRGERPEGRPPREFGGPRGSSPERIVSRALSFDADGDGKLDRAEIEAFAGEMQQRTRGGRGPGRPGNPPEDGEQPERPRRPE